MSNASQSLKSLEQVILELPALIMMKLLWIPKAWYKVVENIFRGCFAQFVPCWVGLGKVGEVIYEY